MVAFLLLVPACDIMGPARACTLIALFSVRVVAIDQVTGDPVHEGLRGHGGTVPFELTAEMTPQY